ncbi:hypothetical protein GOODEAATRI_014828 [Goodea atripinnis]|uniref:Uncharacterized protein n=1 Tax=Goodea atripinnis TaxID=208336 RepID=A0ABV0NE00_9TELE
MSRATDASRRLPNKVQLIAMQPMPVPPLHNPPINGKPSDTNQMNKEIQAALRHKSEIEHHRNKIRLRAKRKGHYDFPAMDDMISSLGEAKEQDHIYQKAQTQIDKILDPDNPRSPSPTDDVFLGPASSPPGHNPPPPPYMPPQPSIEEARQQMHSLLDDAFALVSPTSQSSTAGITLPGVNSPPGWGPREWGTGPEIGPFPSVSKLLF